MEQFKLKVGRCFALISNHLGDLIFLLLDAAIIFIEQALAIVQQFNDHTDKGSLERLHFNSPQLISMRTPLKLEICYSATS